MIKPVLKGCMGSLKVSVAEGVPMPLYLYRLQRSVGPNMVALCLHRVTTERRSTEPYPANTFIEKQLVELIEILYGFLGKDQLVITFDDGYPDAVQFVETFAPRFSQAQFILFVCPRKLAQKAGFRWDLVEYKNEPASNLKKIGHSQDIATENSRAELRKVYLDPRFTLATVESLQAVARLPNVELGNHSNCHFNFARLPKHSWRTEVADSFADFYQLFGPTQHFAFPFGKPAMHFTPEQALYIRETYNVKVWSTKLGLNPSLLSPSDSQPLFYHRYALAGDRSLKMQLMAMCRNIQLPVSDVANKVS